MISYHNGLSVFCPAARSPSRPLRHSCSIKGQRTDPLLCDFIQSVGRKKDVNFLRHQKDKDSKRQNMFFLCLFLYLHIFILFKTLCPTNKTSKRKKVNEKIEFKISACSHVHKTRRTIMLPKSIYSKM